MKICLTSNDTSEMQRALAPFGRYEVSDKCEYDTDIIISWSVTQMGKAWLLRRAFPHIPMINYNWDIYAWVWDKPREHEYDYHRYGKLLRESLDIWVPSECTARRTKEWFGLENTHVILSSVPFYDMETRDERFILNPLRRIPDPNLDWFERACSELALPYQSPNHELPLSEYRKLVATCSFIVSPYFEASTGGLTCMEGYYLGKPVLGSNSPYMGLRDYMGERIEYFQYDDYENLKAKLLDMWKRPRRIDAIEARSFISQNFSNQAMGERIHRRLLTLKGDIVRYRKEKRR